MLSAAALTLPQLITTLQFMEPNEVAKRFLHQNILRANEHMREARQAIMLAFDHTRHITSDHPDLKGEVGVYVLAVNEAYAAVNAAHAAGNRVAALVKDHFEGEDRTPPQEGAFLGYTNLTALQRSLVREGYEQIIPPKDKLPETYADTNRPLPAPKIVSDLEPPRYRKPNRRPKHPNMPL